MLSSHTLQFSLSSMESVIKNHYNSDHLVQNIETALKGAGKNLLKMTSKDLFPIDQLHTGGARASIRLFEKLNLLPAAGVLDAGCGIGGSARLLAGQFNCRVTGIDLADRFIEAARYLTRLTRQDTLVDFHQGSILDLPFENHCFDAVLCQHVLMNIEDKSAAVKEFFRVLKPGGQLILHEITRGINDTAPLLFPVPWARTPSMSFINHWDDLSLICENQGFETAFFSNETPAAGVWWKKVRAFSRKNPPEPGALGPGLIFGSNAGFFGTNMHTNFENNTICLVEAILKKGYDT